MNKQPLDKARDADLRLSVAALHRAARRARELAQQTGTALVISRSGVVEQLQPEESVPVRDVHEPTRPYGGKP